MSQAGTKPGHRLMPLWIALAAVLVVAITLIVSALPTHQEAIPALAVTGGLAVLAFLWCLRHTFTRQYLLHWTGFTVVLIVIALLYWLANYR